MCEGLQLLLVEGSGASVHGLPGPAEGMGLGIEHDCFQIQRLRGSEEQIEVFQRLRQKKLSMLSRFSLVSTLLNAA